MQDVLGSDGFAPYARLGKCDILGNCRIEMVADHQHVEMLVDGVDRVRPRRVGGRWQYVGLPAGLDDVGRVPAASAFGVVSVDSTSLESGQGRFYETGLVQRIGMDGNLHVHFVRDGEAIVDCGRRGSPVFVQLQSHGAGSHLFTQRQTQARVALAKQTKIHRECVQRLQHASDMPRPRAARCGRSTSGRSGPAPYHRRYAGHQSLIDLLRADQVNVAIDCSRGDDRTFSRNDFGCGTDNDIDAWLDVRIAGLANTGYASILDANIRLHDTEIIHDQRVRDDGIRNLVGAALALAHAIANDLAPAKFHLLTINGVVFLHFDPQSGIRQAHAVARSRTEHLGIGLSRDRTRHYSF